MRQHYYYYSKRMSRYGGDVLRNNLFRFTCHNTVAYNRICYSIATTTTTTRRLQLLPHQQCIIPQNHNGIINKINTTTTTTNRILQRSIVVTTTSTSDKNNNNNNNNNNNKLSTQDDSASSASSSSSSSTAYAFDRTMKRLQRSNAARAYTKWRNYHQNNNSTNNGNSNNPPQQQQQQQPPYNPDIISYDYFHEEIANRLVDRLDDIKRENGFPLALDIGAGPGYIYNAICSDDFILYDDNENDEESNNNDNNSNNNETGSRGGIGGVRKLVQLDSSSEMLYRDVTIPVPGSERCETYRLVVDNYEDSGTLPFPDNTFDVVLSSSAFHWVNELPQLFTEIERILKPDGCFLFTMVGGTTLPELRVSFVMAELERDGGISPHVGPFVGLSDVGALLQRAGFTLPTLDVDTVTVTYPDATVLMEHLQRMGENNAGAKRRQKPISKNTFIATAAIYDHLFSMKEQQHDPNNNEIEASIQVIYAIGWKHHESQQVPLKRGTGTRKVGDLI